jgi:ribosomal protein S18 acetylase RimI-like enzyme
MSIEVLAFAPERLEDYLDFFDRAAFADNPDWAGCYCLFYHIPEGEWEKRSGAQNRQGAAELARAGGRTLSVVCFVIAPDRRRRGIARQLLSAACDAARARGLERVEAYPRKDARTAAQHYHGPLELYRGQGFVVHREFPEYWLVRRQLRPGPAAP